jgi:hypothetical protein
LLVVYSIVSNLPDANHVIAIVGATLIDGRGGAPVPDSVVVVRGERIVAAGQRATVSIPAGAQVVDAKGLTLIPGLIDSHFHIDGDDPLPALYLTHGITSVRDPGQWTEAYDVARKGPAPVPRLFLCGPHLDSPPPAYPADSYIVRDAEETRIAALALECGHGDGFIRCVGGEEWARIPLQNR